MFSKHTWVEATSTIAEVYGDCRRCAGSRDVRFPLLAGVHFKRFGDYTPVTHRICTRQRTQAASKGRGEEPAATMMNQNQTDYEYDEYMAQEEEWEREGLLDPAWEKQQRKVRLLAFLCFIYSRNYRPFLPRQNKIYNQ